MIKQTIKTIDPFTETPIVKECWFHYTKMDIVRLETKYADVGGLQAILERVTSGGATNKEILMVLEELITNAYGKRTADGGFLKNETIRQEFMASDTYSDMMFEFFKDAEGAEKAGKFIEAIFPKDLVAEAKKYREEEANKDTEKVEIKENPVIEQAPTRVDIQNMDYNEYLELKNKFENRGQIETGRD